MSARRPCARELGLPVVVGFGIDSRDKARAAAAKADGAVVGTALVRAIEDGKTPSERRAGGGDARARASRRGRRGVKGKRPMLLLCISDVHGHLDALRAVLATAERRAFHKLLVAGDIVFPGPEPLETWRRLTAAGAVMVQGLTDRAVATLDPASLRPRSDHERERLERMKATREALGDLILQRIRRLPTHQRIPLEDGGELLLVHGSPADPGEALTHDMTDAEINALIADDTADVVVCGASHLPFDRLVGGVRIVNVGSVGRSARHRPARGPRDVDRVDPARRARRAHLRSAGERARGRGAPLRRVSARSACETRTAGR